MRAHKLNTCWQPHTPFSAPCFPLSADSSSEFLSGRRGYEHFDGRGRFVSGGYNRRRNYVLLGICGGAGFVVSLRYQLGQQG